MKFLLKSVLFGMLFMTTMLPFEAIANLIDPPGKIYFITNNDKLDVKGSFDNWNITNFELPGNKIENVKVSLEVDLTSVNSGKGMLDKHLQAGEFFGTKTAPKCIVTIDGATAVDGMKYTSEMTLEMKGIKSSLPVQFEVLEWYPLKIKGTADYQRRTHGIGKLKEGAYFNLLPNVVLEFEATMPGGVEEELVEEEMPEPVDLPIVEEAPELEMVDIDLETEEMIEEDAPVRVAVDRGIEEVAPEVETVDRAIVEPAPEPVLEIVPEVIPEETKLPGTIAFKAKNDKLTAQGTFNSWVIKEYALPDGKIENIHVLIEVDIASVSTGMDGLDKHLQASDFFDVASFPNAKIEIDGATLQKDKTYHTVMGMEIKGKRSQLPATFEVVSTNPLVVQGTAEYQRGANGVGDMKQGAYYNLLPTVEINFRATMPK